ncbi:SbcC/MukB-like Walker B domain-containing protein [Sphingomonas parva]|nr:SbcC/MukB-like Walker B domain-containing protein [Sphingomonas parva]
MELRRIVLIQWHLFHRADLDLWGDAAILGQNRSGKSTLIDLIQAVMTGGSSHYYRFNRSAGEGGGRSERTLAAYALGQLNEESFKRPESWTHIALVFEDREGGRPPVSIGLCIEASQAHGAEVIGRYVAPGISLDSEMLLEEPGASRPRSGSWTVVRQRLVSACAAAGQSLMTHDVARNYIREYMRILFTGRRTPEPERFARAFVLALSFVDKSSLEQFVKSYLLAANPIDIGELRESIQRYREIQKTIHELERRLEALRSLKSLVDRFVAKQEEEDVARGVEQLASLIEAGGALVKYAAELRERQRLLQLTIDEIGRADGEIASQREILEGVRAQLAAENAAGRRAVVELQIREIERDRAAAMARLQARYLQVARGAQLLAFRERLLPIAPGELIRGLEEIQAASEKEGPPDWPRDPVAMEKLIAAVRTAAVSRLQKVTERRNDAIGWMGKVREDLAAAVERRNQARSGRVSLEDSTIRLMDALRGEGMRPRALCEVSEVLDERWRNAAEALLGRDREAIIVDPEHASRAVEILRRGRDSYGSCRVANTRRLDGHAREARPGTLAATLGSDDSLAMAFIVFRLGNVVLADDQETLLGGGRAVMVDGAYYDGLITEMRRPQGLKIGRAAAPLMQAELDRRVEELQSLLANHERNVSFYEDVLKRLSDLAIEPAASDRLEHLAGEIDGFEERRREAGASLARIAAMIDPALLDAERRALAMITSLEKDREELIDRRGSLRNARGETELKLGAGEGQVGSRLCFATRRRLFRKEVSSRARLASFAERYRTLRPRAPARIVNEMAREALAAREAHRELDRDIRSALGHYKIDFGDAPLGSPELRIVADVRPWVEDGIQALEGNELVQYRRQADEATDRVTRLFRTAFVHELNNRFRSLEGEVEMLRQALRSRPLHNETYHLHAHVRPEFEDLHRLARDCEDDESALDALFGRAEVRDERHARALKQVEMLLGDDQLDFTIFQDYRNYFSFDLRTRDLTTGRSYSFEKRRGVASGAERQVPFYVVIGAALASIYHGIRGMSDPRELGLGLAVFDEAFSKLDGPNQRSLLEFYRSIGLQVAIAAPTEKRAIVYENLDTIVDVFRSGDDAFAESVRIKPHARAEMRAANPQHLSDDELALQLPGARAAE